MPSGSKPLRLREFDRSKFLYVTRKRGTDGMNRP